ncbi:BspA family leucine-rich repeat surface protein [Mycoplasma capricolum]|uniref:BspA family leucine-rich repeat surface protein n=1 Tax=Mycoplasma capricolum TaxID=2095 RepID=UPI0022F39CA9|nr:BspA family leucine-rich repeat surface protein [Mycoplasma capricolum]WBX35820.1 BspA family leucine-rich repeat surface protein [Mycoplasma capricolum subsp. capricolum]
MKKIILLLSPNILIFTFLTLLPIKWFNNIIYQQSSSRKINRTDEKSHVYNTDKTEITEIGYWTRNGAITIKGIPKTVKKVSSSLPPEITSLYGAFSYRNADDVIVTGFERWDTKNITDMSYVFSNNSIVDIDLSFWDTSKVTNMNGMFKNAVKFNNGGKPLKWTTSNVETMESMFDGATNFDQNLKDWKVDRVKNNKNFSKGSIFSNYENKKPKWKGVIEINDPIIKKPETRVPEVIVHPSPPKPKVNIPWTRIVTPATKYSPTLKPTPDSKKGLEITKANLSTTNQQSKKLSTPAIVGIVVGSQVVLTSLGVGTPYLIKKFKK